MTKHSGKRGLQKVSEKARACVIKKLKRLLKERTPARSFRQKLAIAYAHCRAKGYKLPRAKK